MTDTTKLQGLLRSSLRPGWLDRPLADLEAAKAAKDIHNGLVRIAEDFLAAQQALGQSKDFTASGRYKQQRRISEASRERLQREKWSTFVGQLQRRRDAMRKSAATGPSIQDASARMICFSAIWGMIDATDPIALSIMARDCLTRGDLVSFEAILSLPSIHRAALDPDTIAVLETERLESVNPDVAGDLAAMNEVVGDLERLLEDVTGMTEEASPDYEQEAQEARDALREIAEQGVDPEIQESEGAA